MKLPYEILSNMIHDHQILRYYSDPVEEQRPAPCPAYSAVHISTVRPRQPISVHQLPLWLQCEAWMDKLGANPNKPEVAPTAQK